MMTKKQMEELADMVSAKIILELFGDPEARKETIRQQMEEEIPIGSIFPDLSNEELLIGELARLQTILMIYEDREEYEKAGRILRKLKMIQKKLGKI
jgi:hypothetical protein